MTNITISVGDVEEFKEVFCNENQLIAAILKRDFTDVLQGKILDIGGGTADMLSEVIPNQNVTHLDVLDFSSTPIPVAHIRIQGDFLDTTLMDTLKPFDTLFMSHVQQFLDSDIKRLNAAIENTLAKNIILVEDLNNDFLGEVMRFSLSHFKNANPEVQIDHFPFGYKKVTSVPFTAIVSCKDFSSLTQQCLYLMDLSHSPENIEKMKLFLESKLSEPTFTINQEVNLYQK